jgi:hypothetical protein
VGGDGGRTPPYGATAGGLLHLPARAGLAMGQQGAAVGFSIGELLAQLSTAG